MTCLSSGKGSLLEHAIVSPPPKPQHWDELIGSAERLGKRLNCFVRADFYMVAAGPLGGELEFELDPTDWGQGVNKVFHDFWNNADGGSDPIYTEEKKMSLSEPVSDPVAALFDISEQPAQGMRCFGRTVHDA